MIFISHFHFFSVAIPLVSLFFQKDSNEEYFINYLLSPLLNFAPFMMCFVITIFTLEKSFFAFIIKYISKSIRNLLEIIFKKK